jgi:uncharacterized membrane protein YtjA (UPF0391 family)
MTAAARLVSRKEGPAIALALCADVPTKLLFFGDLREPCAGSCVQLLRMQTSFQPRRHIMLGWALTFLVVALIAAALGFGGIAGASAGIAKILFFVFIVLFIIAMVARAMRGQPPL